MKKAKLMSAVLNLFRQNLTREQIAVELKIPVEKLDEEMDLFFSPLLLESAEESSLLFDFDKKFRLLITEAHRIEYSGGNADSFLKNVLCCYGREPLFMWEILSSEDILNYLVSKSNIRGFGAKSRLILFSFLREHFSLKELQDERNVYYLKHPRKIKIAPIKFTYSQLDRLKTATTGK